MAGAREEVLGRIRAALGPDVAPVKVPRSYLVATDLDRRSVLDRFVERVEDYRATVTRVAADDVAIAIERLLDGIDTIVAPGDLDPAWIPDGLTVHRDTPRTPLAVTDLDQAGGVVTAAAVGIAETGTVVLDGGPGQGRRAITLVPDLHIVVVTADQVVGTVPEGVRRLDPTRPQTWISGPSATSDIELDRVEGVHGPRTLHVILIT